MKARYEIDQAEIADMNVEIAFSMRLKEWRELAEQIDSADAVWPASKFLAELSGIIRNIDNTTSTCWTVCEWGRAEPADE